MAIRNALPFEFPFRWNDVRRFFGKMEDEAVDYLDQRDRDLEDYLAGLSGAENIVYANGSNVIADGLSTATITHGMGLVPKTALATPRNSVEALAVTNRSPTKMIVARAGTTGGLDFDWFTIGTVPVDPGAEAYDDIVLTDGPAAFYKFDTTSGDAVDYSGNGNDGVVGSSIVRTADGFFAGESSFQWSTTDLPNNYVEVPAGARPGNATVYAVEMIFKRTVATNFLVLLSSGGYYLYSAGSSNHYTRAQIAYGTQDYTDVRYNTDEWVHLLWGADGLGNHKAYINGEPQGSIAVGNPYNVVERIGQRGSSPGTYKFVGEMARFAVYKHGDVVNDAAALARANALGF